MWVAPIIRQARSNRSLCARAPNQPFHVFGEHDHEFERFGIVAMTGWLCLAGCAALVALGAFLGLAAARDYLPILAASAVVEAAAIGFTWKVARGKPAPLRFAGWAVLAVAVLFLLQGAVGAVDLARRR